jgi:SAM-dependent methyltransferase
MYNAIKFIAKSIVPLGILKKNELFLRSLVLPFYLGSKHQCNICEVKLSKFAVLNNDTSLCPKCGSLPRNRRLWSLLKDELTAEVKILHFSPARSLCRKLKEIPDVKYLTTDYEGEFIADRKFDITNIEVESECFNLIICFHVLEHIIDDQKAMQELFRILEKGGKCLIQTPFKKGGIYEDSSITKPLEREKHFGQKDHVRIYSVEGLKIRLEDAGFVVDVLSFKEETSNCYGFSTEESILVASKSF